MITMERSDVANHLNSQFDSFLEELQTILLKEQGDWLHPRQSMCHPTNLHHCSLRNPSGMLHFFLLFTKTTLYMYCKLQNEVNSLTV